MGNIETGKFICELRKTASGSIQILLYNYISSECIVYYGPKINYLGQIGVYSLVISTVICAITILHITNFFIIRNEVGKTKKSPKGQGNIYKYR